MKEFLAGLCTMRIHSETFRRTSPTKANRARNSSTECEGSDGELWMQCAFPMLLVHDVQNGQRFLLSAVAFRRIETTSLNISA